MGTITVDGLGSFEVDDSFAALPPDQQKAIVDDMVRQVQGGQAPTADADAEVSQAGIGGILPSIEPPEIVGQGLSGFNQGLASVLGLPVDLVNAALKQVGFGAERPFLGGEQIREAFQSGGQIIAPSDDPAARFASRVGQEIGASAIPGLGMLGAGARLGARAAPFLQQAATAPARFAATEAGLATGSGVGAASAQELAPGSTAAELTGQIIGGIAPTAAAGALRGAVRGTGGAGVEQAVREFAEVGATPTAGQGSMQARLLESAFSKSPGGATVFNRAALRQQQRIGEFVEDLAEGVSSRATPTRAGQVIRKGIDQSLGRFKARARFLYGKLNQFVPKNRAVGVPRTTAMLDEITGAIPGAERTSAALANPRLGTIADSFRADAAGGAVPFQALQGLRTRVGEMLASRELIDDVPRGQLKRVYGALTDDMRAAVSQAGPKAKRAFNQANRFYRSNIARIDDFLKPLANKNLPEDVFKAAIRGGDGATQIAAIRGSLTKEQWKTVSAAALNRLGRATPGRQDDIGELFSTETFLTNWNRLDDQAKNALFAKVSPNMRRDLDKVARAASRVRESAAFLRNPSETSTASINAGTIMAALFSGFTGNITALAGIGGTTAVSAAMGKFMTSPAGVRWLARATELPASQLPGHLTRLTAVAKDDPEVAELVQQFLASLGQTTNTP